MKRSHVVQTSNGTFVSSENFLKLKKFGKKGKQIFVSEMQQSNLNVIYLYI
jgi:hypothetical protein